MKFLLKILGVFLGLIANQFVLGQNSANRFVGYNYMLKYTYDDSIFLTNPISPPSIEHITYTLSDCKGNLKLFGNYSLRDENNDTFFQSNVFKSEQFPYI